MVKNDHKSVKWRA